MNLVIKDSNSSQNSVQIDSTLGSYDPKCHKLAVVSNEIQIIDKSKYNWMQKILNIFGRGKFADYDFSKDSIAKFLNNRIVSSQSLQQGKFRTTIRSNDLKKIETLFKNSHIYYTKDEKDLLSKIEHANDLYHI